MYERKVLGLREAWGAIEAMIKEIEAGNYWKHAGFAVVDAWGVLLCFARMDGSHHTNFDMAFRKAYTAITWSRDTSKFLEFIKERPWDESTYGTEFTVCPGGVVILEPGCQPQVVSSTPELQRLGLAEKGYSSAARKNSPWSILISGTA